MDPNECLKQVLASAQNVTDTAPFESDYAQHLAECVEELHNWIKAGGFLPREWERK